MRRLHRLPLATALASTFIAFTTLQCKERRTESLAPPAPSSAPVSSAPVPPPSPPAPPAPLPLSAGAALEDERNTISVFRAAAKSTVFVTEKQVVVDYFRGQAMEVPAGSGTGF